MEVIYTGLRRNADELAETVVQEDADVLGLSILSGAAVQLAASVVDAVKARDLDDVVLLVGGIMSPEIVQQLRTLGIDGVFGPGSSLEEIVALTRLKVAQRRADSEHSAEAG